MIWQKSVTGGGNNSIPAKPLCSVRVLQKKKMESHSGPVICHVLLSLTSIFLLSTDFRGFSLLSRLAILFVFSLVYVLCLFCSWTLSFFLFIKCSFSPVTLHVVYCLGRHFVLFSRPCSHPKIALRSWTPFWFFSFLADVIANQMLFIFFPLSYHFTMFKYGPTVFNAILFLSFFFLLQRWRYCTVRKPSGK